MFRIPIRAVFFFFNDTATTEIYTLSLHDALPISSCRIQKFGSFPLTRRFRRWSRPRRSCRFGLTVALRPNTFRYAAVRPQPAFDAQKLLAGHRGSVGEILLRLFAPNSGK